MKIIDNSTNLTFDSLIIGDVFTPNDSHEYYMRINNHTNSSNRAVNAISLEYGYDAYFLDESIVVKKVDATLVIGTVPVTTNQVITEEKSETKEESEIEKLKKMTLAEIAEYCHKRDNGEACCADCPIYNYCIDTDVVETFIDLHYLFDK